MSLQTLLEESAIGQPGKAVVMGEIADGFVLGPKFRDVLNRSEQTGKLAIDDFDFADRMNPAFAAGDGLEGKNEVPAGAGFFGRCEGGVDCDIRLAGKRRGAR